MQTDAAQPPAVFHVTHWKAGSTWLARILSRCARDRIVPPGPASRNGSLAPHFLDEPIRPGGVYPRVYVTREEFDGVALPARWRRFVVVRDLRDTLVSAYFSLKQSHAENPVLADARARLRSTGLEQGLRSMVGQNMVVKCGEIQASWAAAGEPLIRFEELLDGDAEILERVLIGDCELPLPRGRLRRIVEQSRFERLSGGRRPGEEDPASHFRKGVAGDWRVHFDPSLRRAFKERWGELLIATGYERGMDW